MHQEDKGINITIHSAATSPLMCRVLLHTRSGTPLSCTPFPSFSPVESCWAHAATTVIESTYLILNGGNASTLALSRQQLLACTNEANSPYFGLNCAGGAVDQV